MRKRGGIIRLGAIFALVGVFSLLAYVRYSYPPDLVYDGHPLSYWVRGFGTYGSLGVYPSFLDRKALPYLVATLRRHDGKPWHSWEKIRPYLPGWLRIRLDL